MSSNNNNNMLKDNAIASTTNSVAATVGESALRQVQWLGSRVAAAEADEAVRQQDERRVDNRYRNRVNVATAIVATSNQLRNPYIVDNDATILQNNNDDDGAANGVNQNRRFGIPNVIQNKYNKESKLSKNVDRKVDGTGGSTFYQNRKQLFLDDDENGDSDDDPPDDDRMIRRRNDNKYNNNLIDNNTLSNKKSAIRKSSAKERLVWEALTNLEADSKS